MFWNRIFALAALKHRAQTEMVQKAKKTVRKDNETKQRGDKKKQDSQSPPISTFSQVTEKKANWNPVPLRLTSKITQLHNRPVDLWTAWPGS